MRYRYTVILLLLAVVMHATAQALNDRYHSSRPVVVVCDRNHAPYSFEDGRSRPAGYYVDVAEAVAAQLDVPCRFVMQDSVSAWKMLEQGAADLVFTDSLYSQRTDITVSKAVVCYILLSPDSVAEIHFVGRDRQLIEQMDDQLTRLQQGGAIAELQDRWLRARPLSSLSGLSVSSVVAGLLLLAAIASVVALLGWLCLRRMARVSSDHSRMMAHMAELSQHYAMEDSRSSHDLYSKYEAMLCNPFLAITFYDNNGQLAVENETMKRLHLDAAEVSRRRQPLYGIKGEIANYYVTISCPPADTTT